MLRKNTLVLAGDIGGTKTNLAVYSAGDPGLPLFEASFASSAYGDLETMVAEFLAGYGLSVQRATFGVAGPVINGRAKVTKLSWLVDPESIAKAFKLSKVVVVNDLVATAHGIAALADVDLVCLNQGAPEKHGPLAVIAPGTGLGEAMMFWDGHRYRTQATEGGHALFSPATRQQLALADYLYDRHGAVSFDLMASGRGLPLLYDFMKQEGTFEEPLWLARELATAADPAAVISKAALAKEEESSPLCHATLQLFVEIIAVEAANLALKSLSTGGLFIGGGIPPRIAPIFLDAFLPAFIHGTMRELLAAMPVRLITNPKTALLGAALLALASDEE